MVAASPVDSIACQVRVCARERPDVCVGVTRGRNMRMVSLRLLGDAGACRCARSTNRPDQRIHVTSRMDVRDGERAFVMRARARIRVTFP